MTPARDLTVRISREEINSLPLFHFGGKITLVQSEEELRAAVQCLRRERVVGLDTETRPSFRKGKVNPPTLVQLACADEVFLFHLGWVPLGEGLAAVFEDKAITKTGVAIGDDLRFLARLFPFTARSVLDLGQIAKQHGMQTQGLRGLVAHFLGLRISKTEQCSNWAKKELTPRQVRYAATDAWASLAVYQRMRELELIPPLSAVGASAGGV